MKEDLVTFEQAKALKELGFDWECTHYYSEDNKKDEPREWDGKNFDYYHIKWDYNYTEYMVKVNFNKDALEENLFEDFYSAPTLAQAQKWIREEKGIVILIDYERYDEKESFYCYDIRYTYDNRITVGLEFSTYEKALSSGIDKALELLSVK